MQIYNQSIYSKTVIIMLIAFLGFIGNLKYGQWKNQRDIEAQKGKIQAQADLLEKKNNELSQSLQYLNSVGFKERVARQQLGLKKQGEQVYAFSTLPHTDSGPITAEHEGSNFKKWWNYFFSE